MGITLFIRLLYLCGYAKYEPNDFGIKRERMKLRNVNNFYWWVSGSNKGPQILPLIMLSISKHLDLTTS